MPVNKAERERLKPGHPVAAIGIAEEDRQLVAYQLAIANGEDGRPGDQASAILPLLSPAEA